MAGFLLTLGVVVALVVGALIIFANTSVEKKLAARRREDPMGYAFGSLNEHLVCPHCQTKGAIRVKPEIRTVTSKGTVGGILKTNTQTRTATQVTQHHCDQCATTWDV